MWGENVQAAKSVTGSLQEDRIGKFQRYKIVSFEKAKPASLKVQARTLEPVLKPLSGFPSGLGASFITF